MLWARWGGPRINICGISTFRVGELGYRASVTGAFEVLARGWMLVGSRVASAQKWLDDRGLLSKALTARAGCMLDWL